MSFKTKRVLAATASAAVATLFLAGCAPADNGVAAGCEAYADYQGFEGTEVELRYTQPSSLQKLIYSSSHSLNSKNVQASQLTGTVLRSSKLRLLFALKVELHLI